MEINRRQFISACGSAALINGLQLGFSRQAIAATGKPHTLVYVFLRGGIDGLNLIIPTGGKARANYENYRIYGQHGSLALPRLGAPGAPLVLAKHWGLHPKAGGLNGIWQNKDLAIIHATGLPAGYSTRSHFDAQKYIERGITANTRSSLFTGWLARYLETLSSTKLDATPIPALSSGGATVESLSGFTRAAALLDIGSYSPLFYKTDEKRLFEKKYLSTLKSMYGSSSDLDLAMTNAIDLADTIKGSDLARLQPPSHAGYPVDQNGRLKGISKDFHRVAKLIRSSQNLGVQTATINVGGWDTHKDQKNRFEKLVEDLSKAMLAFYREMRDTGNSNNYTMIVQSEFGRRVRQNGNKGTDHGSGNMMMLMGKRIRGGQFYGEAPTLEEHTLFGNEDIRVTTDYRKVLKEVLGVGFNVSSNDLSTIFPGYRDNSKLNLIESPILFSSGFE